MKASILKFTLGAFGLFALASCTTVESDPSTNHVDTVFTTRIDFQPPDRRERILQIEWEKKNFTAKEEKLKDQLEGLEAEREIIYNEISDYFPECKRQRHCLANVARGGIKRFERYDEVRGQLHEIDRKGIVLESELEYLRRWYELRVRAIYNRYLVYEILNAAKKLPAVHQILVHSLEVFPDRRGLSLRLNELENPRFVPSVVGDLDFRMMGRAVDEASVLATLDVWLNPNMSRPGQPTRYLVTFLVNSHQLDPQFYEENFLVAWSNRFAEPNQALLRREAYCGIYAIASPVLQAKLSPSKTKPCAALQAKLAGVNADRFDHRFAPENWLLPVTFARPARASWSK